MVSGILIAKTHFSVIYVNENGSVGIIQHIDLTI